MWQQAIVIADVRSCCQSSSASPAIVIRPYLSTRYAAENHTIWKGRRWLLQRKPHKSWMDKIKEWSGQLLSSLLPITDNKCWWAAITTGASVGVPQRRPRVTELNTVVSYLAKVHGYCRMIRTVNNIYNLRWLLKCVVQNSSRLLA